jgi:hypothetical protein
MFTASVNRGDEFGEQLGLSETVITAGAAALHSHRATLR